MPGVFDRWMIARALHEPPHERSDAERAEYARELRAIDRRLSNESSLDLETPSHDLRLRTLDRLHQAYMLQPRIADARPLSLTWSVVSSRRALRAAAGLALVAGLGIGALRYGPPIAASADEAIASLTEQVRNQWGGGEVHLVERSTTDRPAIGETPVAGVDATRRLAERMVAPIRLEPSAPAVVMPPHAVAERAAPPEKKKDDEAHKQFP